MSQLDIWSAEEFGTKVGIMLGKAQAIWEDCAELFVQAITHYHVYSYDTSRPRQVDEMLETAGLGSQQNAFRQLLRQTTGITGIGTDKVGHNKQKLAENPDFQGILDKISNGATLREFSGNGKSSSGKSGSGKSGSKKQSISLSDDLSEAEVNAAKALISGLSDVPKEQRLAAIRNATAGKAEAGSMLDQFQHPESREAAEALLKVLVQEEKALDASEVVNSCTMAVRKVQNYMEMKLQSLQEATKSLSEVA